MTNQWKRRRFLSTAGRAAAGLVILPDSRSVWGYPANEKLDVAVVGAGGMGGWNLAHIAGENVEFQSGMRVKPASQPEMTGENIVALCDVDERAAAESFPGRRNPPGYAFARYGGAKKFNDYRQMLDEFDRQIDAVVVSTPNHNHAPASVAAMRLGKHVLLREAGSQLGLRGAYDGQGGCRAAGGDTIGNPDARHGQPPPRRRADSRRSHRRGGELPYLAPLGTRPK